MYWTLRHAHMRVSLFFPALFIFLYTNGAFAQSTEPSALPLKTVVLATARRADVDIKIDGRLDESHWQTLPDIGEFATVEPDTLVPGRHATHLRMFYTEQGLYVAFDLHQPADTLVSRLSSRDQRQINRDAVFITLDSSAEGRYGYWFGIALGDSLMDGTILPERRYAGNWDGPWWGATAVTDTGWSAEMFLPWSMMSMPQTADPRTMGVYASRKVGYLNQRWAWPALPETQPQFMSVLDHLQMEDVAPRQQYSIFPYSSVTSDRVEDEEHYKAGVDLFWRPSTDFQLSATLNPDFGNVEADDVIVNLTAIETFFPEKRLFFLEGQEIFVTAPRATSGVPTTLLNTRRIGGRAFRPNVPAGVSVPATERGQPAELDGALKATGETGGLRYGVLAASEDETRFYGSDALGNPVSLDQDGRDFAVARALYEDSSTGASRSVGWMSTAVTHPERDAYVHAVDGHYLSRTGQWQWDGQLIHSDIDVDGEGSGGFIDMRYSPKQGRNHIAAVEYFDDTVNINDLGFFRRNDVIGTRYIFQERRSDISFGRDLYTQVLIPHEWNTDWQVIRTGVFWEGDIVRHDLSEFRWDLNYFPDRYEDLNSFGNGTYKIKQRSQFALGYSTDSSRPLMASVDARYEGEEMGGHNVSGRAGLVWRPMDRLTTDFSIYHRQRYGWLLHQSGTNMTTFDAEEWNARLDFDFFFTARQQFRASFQWVGIKAFEDEFFTIPARPDDLLPRTKAPGEPSDNFSISTLNFQLRYRWQMAPMSDLFVVYTKNGNQRRLPDEEFRDMFSRVNGTPVSEQLVVKLRYRFGS
ncbi:MAG: DUF5916 domain-containing protein [Cellvibrionaceae bacterium]